MSKRIRKRDKFRERANHIIQEAWEVNGRVETGNGDEVEVQLRILNGLLAIALTEFTARPHDEGRSGPLGELINLRDIMGSSDESF